jgi:hypothetical protein
MPPAKVRDAVEFGAGLAAPQDPLTVEMDSEAVAASDADRFVTWLQVSPAPS